MKTNNPFRSPNSMNGRASNFTETVAPIFTSLTFFGSISISKASGTFLRTSVKIFSPAETIEPMPTEGRSRTTPSTGERIEIS